ncbi:DUF262 domain-containing protein [Nostoc sp. ATCC 53789]|uniref:DUF262 domain-containing protein n=1 Tax=Nostoc sp. ATCC 53789 TaxID=76335 RepID=UPI000DED3723|nr:DUF262 domain-containing protein [Nostoc sp. ATCC 53789]QHG17810.1 DUF262 domain-containing protein [Nostoc sp. ATCC 53789]
MTNMNHLNSQLFKEETKIDDDMTTEDDVEEDDIAIEEEEEISEPFNPTKIRVETRQISIDYLMVRIKNNEIELSPEFQRKFVWNKIAQSRLIESILLRIPIPAFYIDATNEEKWLVIDGLQRLTTLKEFVIDKKLKLTGLESFTLFNGKIYDEIPHNYQRRIEETLVTVIFLEPGTDSEFKQAIFERINTSALSLSTQEIRHALNQGKATKLLGDLAVASEFKKAIDTDKGIKSDRMADRECILRVLVFMIKNQELFQKNTSFKKILDQAMAYINIMSDEEIKIITNDFISLMNLAFEVFGKDAFRKMKKGAKRYPINKALFEAWSVNLYKLNAQEIEILKERKEIIKQKIIDLTNEGKFNTTIYRSTGTLKTVLHRLNEIEQVIKSVLS